MKPYDTLIRLADRALDEKRLVLAGLEDRLDAVKVRRQAIEDQLAAEQARARESTEVIFGYGAYAEDVIRRREAADAEIAAIEIEVSEAREEVRTAFAELKRFEITHERKLAQQAKEQADKDQAALDEVALNLDRRNDDRL